MIKRSDWLGVILCGMFLAGCASRSHEVQTSRVGAKLLSAPTVSEGFHFAIFADRTGGDKEEGMRVWQRAIEQVNQMGPDFVCTVGDLVWGYGDQAAWHAEAEAFHADSNKLKSPLYPVAGNHDVYWLQDTQGRPKTQHESDYETHFGPAWYAFEYENSWFVVLYSDEGDPETGEKGYHDPNQQMMSDAQFKWLEVILKKARGADHVFVFLHHPRWRQEVYGHDWDNIHQALVKAGNVSAVFAGHFHSVEFSEKDGIDYSILGTTGGVIQEHSLIKKHLLYWVNVQGQSYSVTGIGVGETLNLTGIGSQGD